MVDQINNGGPRVRRSLKDDIKEIMGQGENKNKIDTKAEYDAIGNLLNNNANYSSGEIAFLEGYRLEYENAQKAKEAKELEDNMTPGVKKEVDKLVKKMTKESNLTPDLQANELALMLKDTKNRLNPADEKYIKDALINNGYGNLLPKEKKEVAKAESPSAETEPISSDEKIEEPNSSKENVVNEDINVSEKADTTPPNPKVPKKADTTPPNPKVSKKENTSVNRGVKKHKISAKARGEGMAKGDDFANATIDNPNAANIRKVCESITVDNAYSFFKYLDTDLRTYNDWTKKYEYEFTQRMFNVEDKGQLVNIIQAYQAVNKLGKQALSMGLNNTKAFKNLHTVILALYDQAEKTPSRKGDLSLDMQVRTDKAIEAMIKEMDKHIAP